MALRGRQAPRVALVPAAAILLLAIFPFPFAPVVRAFEDDEFVGADADLHKRPAQQFETGPPEQLTSGAGSSSGGVSSGGGSSASEAEAGGQKDRAVEFPLEHDLLGGAGGGRFEPAGQFTARLRETASGALKLSKGRLQRLPFSAAEQAAFEELVRADGYYRVRVPACVLEGGGGCGEHLLASVRARSLGAGQLAERIELHTGPGGRLVGVSYSTPGDCSGQRHAPAAVTDWTFCTEVVFVHGTSAPRLLPSIDQLTAAAGGAAAAPKVGGIPGEPETKVEEKTFLQKYWMYLIPAGLIFINAMATAVPPEGGAAAGGGGGGGGQRAAAGGGGGRR